MKATVLCFLALTAACVSAAPAQASVKLSADAKDIVKAAKPLLNQKKIAKMVRIIAARKLFFLKFVLERKYKFRTVGGPKTFLPRPIFKIICAPKVNKFIIKILKHSLVTKTDFRYETKLKVTFVARRNSRICVNNRQKLCKFSKNKPNNP